MDIISTSATGRVVSRHIEDIFKTKPELAKFFLNHPKRINLEMALAKGLQGADARKVLKHGPEHIDEVSREIVRFWCQTMLQIHEHSLLSQNEKRRLETESRQLEVAQDTVRDIVSNIDEDDFDLQEI